MWTWAGAWPGGVPALLFQRLLPWLLPQGHCHAKPRHAGLHTHDASQRVDVHNSADLHRNGTALALSAAAMDIFFPHVGFFEGADQWGEVFALLPVPKELERLVHMDNAVALAAIARSSRQPDQGVWPSISGLALF